MTIHFETITIHPVKRAAVGREIERQFEYFGRNYPQFDASSNGIVLQFLRTGFLCRQFLSRRLKSYDLSGQAFSVLLTLETLPDRRLPMNDIGHRLGVTRANVTGLVDTLEKRRLVARRPSERDRRVTHVVLTATGRQRIRSILPAHFRTVRRLFDNFNTAEKAQFAGLLDRFADALN